MGCVLHQQAATAQRAPRDHRQSGKRQHRCEVGSTAWSRNNRIACSSADSRGQMPGAALSDYGRMAI